MTPSPDRRPPPTDALVDALQDRVHTTGAVRAARSPMRERMDVLDWWTQWGSAWRTITSIYLADCERGR